MMKFNGLLCGLLMAAASTAHAQETATETTAAAAGDTEVRRVSQILGSTVQLQGVNNFGKVEDIILSDDGGIGYLVVAADGKYLTLPWNAGNVDYAQRVVTYDVTPQVVQPFYFQRNAYPNFRAPQFVTRVRQAFPNARGVRAATTTVRSAQPGGPVVEETEKVRVKPNGKVIVKDKEKIKNR